MSTSILKALSGNSDIKRLSANIIYIFYLSCQEAKYDRVISLKARANSPTPCHWLERLRENRIKWWEGKSKIVKCVGVETPHCGDVEMWWIHILSVAVHIKFAFIQEWALISIVVTHDIHVYLLYSHLKRWDPHCSSMHPHCSTLHPHSKCRDVVDQHYIHILRVKARLLSHHNTVTGYQIHQYSMQYENLKKIIILKYLLTD